MTDTFIVEELKTKAQIILEKTIETCEFDIQYHTKERDRALKDLKAEYESKY